MTRSARKAMWLVLLVVVCAAGCGGKTPFNGADTAPDTLKADGVDVVADLAGEVGPETSPPLDSIDTPLPADTFDASDADTPCVPDCKGKECGDDGCGGSCGECSFDHVCDQDICIAACVSICTPPGLTTCFGDQAVQTCIEIEVGEKTCYIWDDEVVECPPQHICEDGACVCVPDCDGKECGSDGCGGSCGWCDGSLAECIGGQCYCDPDCSGKECGVDGCTGSCGECPDPYTACAQDGTCQDACDVACEGRECGYVPCGLMCGTCAEGMTCTLDGVCVWDWECPYLTGVFECGPKPFGGYDWGSCPQGQTCTGGYCTEACLPDCAGKVCGDDGCGGSCGDCGDLLCNVSGVCGGECSSCPAGITCHDIDFSDVSLTTWSQEWALVVEQAHGVDPLSGGAMLALDAAVTPKDEAWAQTQVCLPPGAWVVSITWRVLSHFYPGGCVEQCCMGEYSGDYSPKIRMYVGDNSFSLENPPSVASLLGLCDPEACFCAGYTGCIDCGEDYLGLVPFEGFPHPWRTPWHEELFLVSVGVDDPPQTISLMLDDVYQSNSPALLVDRIRVIQKDTFCEERECGPNPSVYLGSCGECPPGSSCAPGGLCEADCVQECAGKECGPDGCGGFCGLCSNYGECSPEGTCEPCQPDCEGKECGPDGCGGWCSGPIGECYLTCGKACVDGVCVVDPCGSKECGDDGCGGSCGTCPDGESCLGGACCMPDCEGKSCGNDGCGGSCGNCPPGAGCVHGVCLPLSCGDIECGTNATGALCGACEGYDTCLNGACVYLSGCDEGEVWDGFSCCEYDYCEGKVCGDSSCNTPCGYCGCGEECLDGACVWTACDGVECGFDGCGGTCGVCAGGCTCNSFGFCAGC